MQMCLASGYFVVTNTGGMASPQLGIQQANNPGLSFNYQLLAAWTCLIILSGIV
jgi:hypothetical protein